MLLMQLWEHLSNCIENPIGLANFREKMATPHCNLGVSISQARTFPLLICMIYFSLSRNSTNIITLD